MLAFTNTKVTKIELVASLERHRDADAIVQGQYWTDGKGCAVGCSLHDFHANPNDHAAYEPLFGIPCVLARLEDGIFEGLPIDEAKAWPLRFANAIRPGADLSMIWPKFATWLLGDPDHGVIRHAKTNQVKKAIQDVADAYAAKSEGRNITSAEWLNLRRAAAAAAAAGAAGAAADAADAADAAAAAGAAGAYAGAAADAAAAAAGAAGAYAARRKARIAQAGKLIELLEAA